MEDKLNTLPAYLNCDCGYKHYLSLNRDIQGKWSVGYIEFNSHTGIHAESNFETIEDCLDWLLELDKDNKLR